MELKELITFVRGGVSVGDAASELLGEETLVEMADPSLFRVGFQISKHYPKRVIDKKAVAELQKGVMKGLKGISDSREIRFTFFGGMRDAFLVMKADAVRKANPHIQEMPYDNPEALLANDMELFRRIYDQPSDKGFIDMLFNQIDGELVRRGMHDAAYPDDKEAVWTKLSSLKLDKINSISDLAGWLTKVVVKDKKVFQHLSGISKADWKSILTGILMILNKDYKHEGEWIIRQPVFKVPSKSLLVVMYADFPEIPKDLVDKWRAGDRDKKTFEGVADMLTMKMRDEGIVKEIKKKLGSRYKLKFLPSSQYFSMQRKYFARKNQRGE